MGLRRTPGLSCPFCGAVGTRRWPRARLLPSWRILSWGRSMSATDALGALPPITFVIRLSPSLVELFPNKEEGRLYSKKLWRKPTDGNSSERRASNESLNRLVPSPIRRPVARLQRHLRGHATATLCRRGCVRDSQAQTGRWHQRQIAHHDREAPVCPLLLQDLSPVRCAGDAVQYGTVQGQW